MQCHASISPPPPLTGAGSNGKSEISAYYYYYTVAAAYVLFSFFFFNISRTTRSGRDTTPYNIKLLAITADVPPPAYYVLSYIRISYIALCIVEILYEYITHNISVYNYIYIYIWTRRRFVYTHTHGIRWRIVTRMYIHALGPLSTRLYWYVYYWR